MGPKPESLEELAEYQAWLKRQQEQELEEFRAWSREQPNARVMQTPTDESVRGPGKDFFGRATTAPSRPAPRVDPPVTIPPARPAPTARDLVRDVPRLGRDAASTRYDLLPSEQTRSVPTGPSGSSIGPGTRQSVDRVGPVFKGNTTEYAEPGLTRAVRSGLGVTQATTAGGLAVLGRVAGADEFAGALEERAAEGRERAALNPLTHGSFGEAKGVRATLGHALETGVQGAMSSIPSLGTGAAAAAAGLPGLGVGLLMAGTSYLPNLGDVAEEMRQAGVPQDRADRAALAAAVPMAALDVAPEAALLERLRGQVARKLTLPEAARSLARQSGVTALQEAPTEGLQGMVGHVATDLASGRAPNDEARLRRGAEEGLAGALAGLVSGGAGGAAMMGRAAVGQGVERLWRPQVDPAVDATMDRAASFGIPLVSSDFPGAPPPSAPGRVTGSRGEQDARNLAPRPERPATMDESEVGDRGFASWRTARERDFQARGTPEQPALYREMPVAELEAARGTGRFTPFEGRSLLLRQSPEALQALKHPTRDESQVVVQFEPDVAQPGPQGAAFAEQVPWDKVLRVWRRNESDGDHTLVYDRERPDYDPANRQMDPLPQGVGDWQEPRPPFGYAIPRAKDARSPQDRYFAGERDTRNAPGGIGVRVRYREELKGGREHRRGYGLTINGQDVAANIKQLEDGTLKVDGVAANAAAGTPGTNEVGPAALRALKRFVENDGWPKPVTGWTGLRVSGARHATGQPGKSTNMTVGLGGERDTRQAPARVVGFHGTKAKFDRLGTDPEGHPTWLAEREDLARDYADQVDAKGRPRVIRAELSPNAKVLDLDEAVGLEDMDAISGSMLAQAVGFEFPGSESTEEQALVYWVHDAGFAQAARQAGYDVVKMSQSDAGRPQATWGILNPDAVETQASRPLSRAWLRGERDQRNAEPDWVRRLAENTVSGPAQANWLLPSGKWAGPVIGGGHAEDLAALMGDVDAEGFYDEGDEDGGVTEGTWYDSLDMAFSAGIVRVTGTNAQGGLGIHYGMGGLTPQQVRAIDSYLGKRKRPTLTVDFQGNGLTSGEFYGATLLGAEAIDAIVQREAARGTMTFAYDGKRFMNRSGSHMAATRDQRNAPLVPPVVARALLPAELAKLRRDTAARLMDWLAQMPTAVEMANVALAGRAKRGWYHGSATALVDVFGQDATRFAAFLAALSPQTSVENNAINALNVWAAWLAAGRPTDRATILRLMGEHVQGSGTEESVLDAWKNNAVTALTMDDPARIILSGPKVNSFFLNLIGVVDEVTNDAWMANYALVDQEIFAGGLNAKGTDPGKGTGYLAMSARVRQAAAKLTEMTGEVWTPAEVQETVWSWAKTVYEMASAKGETRSAVDLVNEGAITDALIAATPDFRGLFGTGIYRDILVRAGYGDQVARLDHGSPGRAPERRAPGEASPTPAPRELRRAAGRLDELRERRRLEKEAERAAKRRAKGSRAEALTARDRGRPVEVRARPGSLGDTATPGPVQSEAYIAELDRRRANRHLLTGEAFADAEALAERLWEVWADARIENMHVMVLDDAGQVQHHGVTTMYSPLLVGADRATGDLFAEVAEVAVRGGWTRVVIAHNHPVNDHTPSKFPGDLQAAGGIRSILESVGLDSSFLVVAADGWSTYGTTLDSREMHDWRSGEKLPVGRSIAGQSPADVVRALADAAHPTAELSVVWGDYRMRVAGYTVLTAKGHEALKQQLLEQQRAHGMPVATLVSRSQVGEIRASSLLSDPDLRWVLDDHIDVDPVTGSPESAQSQGTYPGSDPEEGYLNASRTANEGYEDYRLAGERDRRPVGGGDATASRPPALAGGAAGAPSAARTGAAPEAFLTIPSSDGAPRGPAFYSRLELALQDAPFPKAPASQWRGWLANAKNLSQKEVQYVLGEALDRAVADGRIITAKDLLQIAKANRVATGVLMAPDAEAVDVRAQIDEIDREINRRGLTYLERHMPVPAHLVRDLDARRKALQQENAAVLGRATPSWEEYFPRGGTLYREMILTGPSAEGYESGHFGGGFTGRAGAFPNYLAHARVSVVVDAQGRRLLYVGELQSDLYQGIRKAKMFAPEALQPRIDELNAEIAEANAEVRRLQEQMEQTSDAGVAYDPDDYQELYRLKFLAERRARRARDAREKLKQKSLNAPRIRSRTAENIETLRRVHENAQAKARDIARKISAYKARTGDAYLAEDEGRRLEAQHNDAMLKMSEANTRLLNRSIGLPDAALQKTDEWLGVALRALYKHAAEEGLDGLVLDDGKLISLAVGAEGEGNEAFYTDFVHKVAFKDVPKLLGVPVPRATTDVALAPPGKWMVDEDGYAVVLTTEAQIEWVDEALSYFSGGTSLDEMYDNDGGSGDLRGLREILVSKGEDGELLPPASRWRGFLAALDQYDDAVRRDVADLMSRRSRDRKKSPEVPAMQPSMATPKLKTTTLPAVIFTPELRQALARPIAMMGARDARNAPAAEDTHVAWSELYRALLLSTPATHVANIAGTGLYQASVVRPAEPAARAFDWLMSLVSGQRTKLPIARDLAKASRDAVKGAAAAEDVGKRWDQEAGQQGRGGFNNALAKRFVTAIFGALKAQDRIYGLGVARRSVAEQAQVIARYTAKANKWDAKQERATAQNLATNPTEAMLLQAFGEAALATFNNKQMGPRASAGKISVDIANAGEQSGWLARLLGTVLIPFRSTPANVAARTIESTPLGLAMALPDVVRWAEGVRRQRGGKPPAGGPPAFGPDDELPSVQRRLAERLGRTTTGVLAHVTLGFLLAMLGVMVKERYEWVLKVFGRTVRLGRLSPVTSIWGVGAEFHAAVSAQDNSATSIANRVGAEALSSLARTPVMDAGSEGQRFLKRPASGVGDFFADAGTGVIPGPMKRLAQAMDPVERITRSPWERIQANIPVARERLEPDMGPLGDPLTKTWYERFGGLIDPTVQRGQARSPMMDWLAAHDIEVPDVKPQSGETSEQYANRKRRITGARRERLARLFENPSFQTRPDSVQVQIVRKALNLKAP